MRLYLSEGGVPLEEGFRQLGLLNEDSSSVEEGTSGHNIKQDKVDPAQYAKWKKDYEKSKKAKKDDKDVDEVDESLDEVDDLDEDLLPEFDLISEDLLDDGEFLDELFEELDIETDVLEAAVDLVDGFLDLEEDDFDEVTQEDLESCIEAFLYLDDVSSSLLESKTIEEMDLRRIRTRVGKGGRKVTRREKIDPQKRSLMVRLQKMKERIPDGTRRFFNKALKKVKGHWKIAPKTSDERKEQAKRGRGASPQKIGQRRASTSARARRSHRLAQALHQSSEDEQDYLSSIIENLTDISNRCKESIEESDTNQLIDDASILVIEGFENVCDTAFHIACKINDDLGMTEWEEGDERLEAGAYFDQLSKDASDIIKAIQEGDVDLDDAIEDLKLLSDDLHAGIDQLKLID